MYSKIKNNSFEYSNILICTMIDYQQIIIMLQIIISNYIIMRAPLIFTFNIRRSVFQQFGASIFAQVSNLNLQSGQVLLLPIVNNLNDGIQMRAQSFSKLLPNLLKYNQVNHCHLISYSLSGIDARCAISKYGINKYAKSLTTIATPHLGSKLAWLSQRKIFNDKKSESIARLLGIGLQPFWEIIPQNMKHFNRRILDKPEVKYFSIGAERLPNNMNEHLQQTGNHLRQQTKKNFIYENDGVVGHDECQWGEHLVNFQADHMQIGGINKYDELKSVFQLIEDNVLHHDEANI